LDGRKDHFEHLIGGGEYVVIPETQHLETLLFEP